MSHVIRISESLYKRLASHANGFDTPATVIEQILNHYEGIDTVAEVANTHIEKSNNLEIVYKNESEESFKQKLLIHKKAFIKLYFTNGDSEIKEWSTVRFNETSSVNGNLRSGYLRGWKEKGIKKADLAINKHTLD